MGRVGAAEAGRCFPRIKLSLHARVLLRRWLWEPCAGPGGLLCRAPAFGQRLICRRPEHGRRGRGTGAAQDGAGVGGGVL